MKPEAQKFIKLLKFDPAHPSSKLPLTVYSHSDGQCKQLSQPAEGELHDHLRWARSW